MKAIDFISAEIGTVSSRADHSCSFRVTTAELTNDQAAVLLGYHGSAARVLVMPHDGGADEVVEVKKDRDVKTPSQRLRAVVFVHFQQSKETGDFEAFYRAKMELIIEGYKQKNLE